MNAHYLLAFIRFCNHCSIPTLMSVTHDHACVSYLLNRYFCVLYQPMFKQNFIQIYLVGTSEYNHSNMKIPIILNTKSNCHREATLANNRELSIQPFYY